MKKKTIIAKPCIYSKMRNRCANTSRFSDAVMMELREDWSENRFYSLPA